MVKHIIEYLKNLATDAIEALYEEEYENMPVKEIKFKPKPKVKKATK